MFLKGQKYDLAMDRTNARRTYEKAIAKDGAYSPALRNLAVLDYEAGLYAQSRDSLLEAVKRNPADGPSWYFLGLCYLALNDAKEALQCGYQCARCFGGESIGFDLAGRALMRSGDRAGALKTFEKAVAANPRDDQIQNHCLIAQYALGDPSVFERAGARIHSDPTDLIPRCIFALKNPNRLEPLAEEVRAFLGENDFEMIDAALTFTDLGLYKEAADLLEAVCVRPVPVEMRSPLPLYSVAFWRAQCQNNSSAKEYLKQAAKTWKDCIFPSRPEEIVVFQYAISQNPDDAHAHLHLGNLYAHLGRLDESVACWQNAARLNPSLNIAWRNLGLYQWAIKEDLGAAADLYRKAIAARPKDQTLYRDLSDILIADKNRPQAIDVLNSTPFETLRRADIIIMLAQAYVDEKRYSEAIDLLEGTPYFVNWEGQTITWDLFNRSHIERGKQRLEKGDSTGALGDFDAAVTYPANIGVGRSNKPREAPAQYWRGKALFAQGKKDEARSAWKLGASGIPDSEEQNRHIQLCQTMLQESP
jgi:tetratricopeptide (TPR) repeat protein